MGVSENKCFTEGIFGKIKINEVREQKIKLSMRNFKVCTLNLHCYCH
jgi:hypothetical protein